MIRRELIRNGSKESRKPDRKEDCSLSIFISLITNIDALAFQGALTFSFISGKFGYQLVVFYHSNER